MAIDYLRRYAQPHQRPSTATEYGVEAATQREHADLEEVFNGRLHQYPSGQCFIADTAHAASHRHGLHPLSGLHAVSTRSLAILARDGDLAYADLSKAVFLDTETTGLGMGVGTYVFLVGAGYLENGAFRVQQFFLRSPGEEPAFLAALYDFLGQFSTIVSFNGRAFDWPLLEYRFIGSRLFRAPPLVDPLHIDLLHPARRLWKRRLESCSLSSLERSILAVSRTHEDVPGWLIPSLYFQYLRSGNASLLSGVFYHNLQDILSLATLTVHMDRVLSDPTGGLVDAAEDFVCLARQFDLIGEVDMAVVCLEEALDRSPAGWTLHEALIRLAVIYKRDRRWELALPIWDRLIDEGDRAGLHGLVERAKYYEHVERDYLEALDDTRRALNLTSLVAYPLYDRYRVELEHRETRLINRLYPQRSWSKRR